VTNQYQIEDFAVGLAPEDERPEDYDLALSLGNIPAAPPPPPQDPEQQQQQGFVPPDWLASIPVEEQPALIDGWMARMSPEMRAQMPSVAQVINIVRGNAVSEVQQQIQAEQQAAAAVVTLQNLMEPVAGYMTDTQREGYEESLQRYSDAVATQAGAREMRAAVGQAYAQFNLPLDQIPQEVLAAASDAPTAGQAAAVYMSYLAHVVSNATEQVVTQREQGRSQAGDAATIRRYQHEALGQLAKDKRIRITPAENGEYWATLAAETPPGMGDGVPAAHSSGFNPDSYRALNDGLEPVNADAIDAWTAQYANADA
jgi:hypothetical protein